MKKALVFFSKGFEEVETLTIVDYLRRAKIETLLVSVNNEKNILGAHNIEVKADCLLSQLNDFNEFDAFIVPGGSENAKNMRKNKEFLNILKNAFELNKLVAAICAGPTVLLEAGILNNKNITSYPGVFKDDEKVFNYKEDKVVIDGNVITSRGPALTIFFALEIIKYLSGIGIKDKISEEILLEMM